MSEKPPVKSYCGGKPNYCTPEVDKGAERMKDPTLEVIEMQQALTKIQAEMRMTGRENLDSILLLSGQIRERLIILQEWVLERKENWT